MLIEYYSLFNIKCQCCPIKLGQYNKEPKLRTTTENIHRNDLQRRYRGSLSLGISSNGWRTWLESSQSGCDELEKQPTDHKVTIEKN